MKIEEILAETDRNTASESKSKQSKKYLGPTEKVKNISPVLKRPYGSAKQTTLMNKFFGSS